jgi:hypothetical protein
LKTLGPIGPRAVGERVKGNFIFGFKFVETFIHMSLHRKTTAAGMLATAGLIENSVTLADAAVNLL